MGNTIPIKYHGETLACIDPSQVEAVVPWVFYKERRFGIFDRIANFIKRVHLQDERIQATKVMFKDGSSIKISIPFFDFINLYP